MLTIHTARAPHLQAAFIRELRRCSEDPEQTQYIIVPRLQTLQMERLLFRELNLSGSFAYQVGTPERFCLRIFDSAGIPEGAHVDTMGRIMLMRASIVAASDKLSHFAAAAKKRGFAVKCAEQIARLRQAGVTPKALEGCAAESGGVLKAKLSDLAVLQRAYEDRISGKYLDGESGYMYAIRRAKDAAFLKHVKVWFYGFDVMPVDLARLTAAIAAVCPDTHVFIPADENTSVPDAECYMPLLKGIGRLERACGALGAETAHVRHLPEKTVPSDTAAASPAPVSLIKEDAAAAARTIAEASAVTSPISADATAAATETATTAAQAIAETASPKKADSGTGADPVPSYMQDPLPYLARTLYASNPGKRDEKPAADPDAVRLMRFRTVPEECAYAAAYCRYLAQQKGMRWRDMRILVGDMDCYREPLRTAFRAYNVPLFVSDSRPAANYPLCECLLSALNLVGGSNSIVNVLAMMRSGFMPVMKRDISRLANYAEQYALRANAFFSPFKKGKPEEVERLEAARAGMMAPVILLRDRMRAAKDLHDQMNAVFTFLSDIGAERRMRAHIHALEENGMRAEAGAVAQIWNYIVEASDQMVALLGGECLSVQELTRTLLDSLSAIIVKALPQSDDAVSAQGMHSMLTEPVRALLIVGETDAAAEKPDGLLDTDQRNTLGRYAEAYLGPDESELAQMRRFRMKHALSQTTDALLVSMAQTNATGDADLPGPLFSEIRSIFSNVKPEAVLRHNEATERVLRATPEAALALAAKGLSEVSEKGDLNPLDKAALAALAHRREYVKPLAAISDALSRRNGDAQIAPATAEILYNDMTQQSITSLETFAECPFRYFARYGLHPKAVEVVPLDNSDEGTFLHRALESFLTQCGDAIADMSRERAQQLMDRICDIELEAYREQNILGSTPLDRSNAEQLRRKALNCADLVMRHLEGSSFRVEALEREFGEAEADEVPLIVEGCRLKGKIDRVDRCDSQHAVRIIDCKRSSRELDLWKVYHGLSLQLAVYAAYATQQDGARNAGMYYLTLGEGLQSTPKRDGAAADIIRFDKLRMKGIAPDDDALIAAMSPAFKKMVEEKKDAERAAQTDFDAIKKVTLERAGEDIRAIRAGDVSIRPFAFGNDSGCAFCDFKKICAHDARVDARDIRRLRGKGKDAEALEAIRDAAENGFPEEDPEEEIE